MNGVYTAGAGKVLLPILLARYLPRTRIPAVTERAGMDIRPCSSLFVQQVAAVKME